MSGMIINPSRFGAVIVPTLADIVANMELELDFSETTSYPGSGQTVSNIILSPDSGAGQTDNDWFFGETSSVEASDPTFNTDQIDFDGGDFCTSTFATGTAYMNALADNTNAMTFILVFSIGSTLANTDYWFANNLAAGNTDSVIGFNTRSDGNMRLVQGSGTSAMNSDIAIGMATSTVDNVLILSVDMPNSRMDAHYNSRTPVSTTSITFDGTNTDNTAVPKIAAFGNGNLQQPNGNSLKFFAIRADATDDTEAEAIIDELTARGLIGTIP